MLNSLPVVSDIRECLPVFHMLFDSIQIGISITDRAGVIIYCNESLAEIDNMPRKDIIGESMCTVYDFTEETSPVMQVLRSGTQIVDKVNSYRTRSGNLVNASCTIYPLYCSIKGICGAICYTQNYTLLNVHFKNVQNSIENNSKVAQDSNAQYTFDSFVGSNVTMEKALHKARLSANNSSSVMLIGETGVGKELFAQSIHSAGSRSQSPYTAINCSAVPETLLEGILFGTTKGVFTGALTKAGLFEITNGGTLFLDEVDSMPIGLQSKLLRVLQEKRVRRIGDTVERKINVRIISAVGRNPDVLMREKLLRPDFYYRLGVIKIFIPPLCERMDDLETLTLSFLKKASRNLFRPVPRFSDEAMECLYQHKWPGNVRELEHVIEAVLNILDQQMEIDCDHLAYACPELVARQNSSVETVHPLLHSQSRADDSEYTDSTVLQSAHVFEIPVCSTEHTDKPLMAATQQAECTMIQKALETSAGNQTLAAKLLGISPQLLRYKIKKHKILIKKFIPDKI